MQGNQWTIARSNER